MEPLQCDFLHHIWLAQRCSLVLRKLRMARLRASQQEQRRGGSLLCQQKILESLKDIWYNPGKRVTKFHGMRQAMRQAMAEDLQVGLWD